MPTDDDPFDGIKYLDRLMDPWECGYCGYDIIAGQDYREHAARGRTIHEACLVERREGLARVADNALNGRATRADARDRLARLETNYGPLLTAQCQVCADRPLELHEH